MATVKVEGLKELERKLRALDAKAAGQVSRDAMRAGGQLVLDEARSRAPVLTGQTRDALRLRTAKTKRGFSAKVETKDGFYKGDQFYAAFLEFGTHKMKARPFIRPAFDAKVHAVIDKVVSELTAALNSASE